MHNQHAGLSQLLAEQHRTQRWEQAAHARLVRRAHPARQSVVPKRQLIDRRQPCPNSPAHSSSRPCWQR
jgi:hypothetical protein